MTELDRYIGAIVLRAFLLILAGLTALFSLLSFVEQLGLVGQGQFGALDALDFTLLTAPDRLLQAAPVSMLLATLLGLGGLARHAELTAMRSFGLSEARIIGAVLKLCAPVLLALFLVAQFVIPPAQLAAQRQQAAALGAALPGLSDGGFWAQSGREFLNVQSFTGGDELHGVSLFSFAPDGSLQSYVQAAQARIEPDGAWELTGIVRKQMAAGEASTDQPAALSWRPFLSTRQLHLLAMPPQTMPPVALYDYVQMLKRQHQPAEFYAQALWGMAAVPLALLGMVLMAAPFVFGPQRAGHAGRQLLIGALLGIVFLLCQQITGYAGLLLDVSPALSALAPALVLLGVGAWLLARGHARLTQR